MTSQDLLIKLDIASDSKTSPKECSEILCALLESIPLTRYPEPSMGQHAQEVEAVALRQIVQELFTSTIEHARPCPRSLFPVFSLLCGDKEGRQQLLAEIDWNMLPHFYRG